MKQLMLAFVLAFAFWGCDDDESTGTAPVTKSLDDIVVEAGWLKDNLKNENLLIIDSRSSVEEYNTGHVPGAIYAMWQHFAEAGMLLPPDSLAGRFAALGITKEKEIIVYADNHKDNNAAFGQDGRIVWMLQMAGYNVRVLDGGFPYWKHLNYEVETDSVVPKASEVTSVTLDSSYYATMEQVKKAVEKKRAKIIDTRTLAEYNKAQLYKEARGGRLPGAIHIYFGSLLDSSDSRFLSDDAIEALLTEEKITKDDVIYPYCTSGIRSAHMTMVLRALGYEKAANFDASFWYWAADTTLPLE